MRRALLLAVLLGCDGTSVRPPAQPISETPPIGAAGAPVASDPGEGSNARSVACIAGARACIASVKARDAEAIIDCMPDEMLRTLGGRDRMVSVMRNAFAKFDADHMAITDARVDDSPQLADAGKRTFAIVRSRVTVRVEGREVIGRGYLLGVSDDGGRTWKFIDGAGLSAEMVARVYPDFPRSLSLPEKEPPIVKPASG